MQVHYACARSDTVEDIGQLPGEVLAFQGSGELSCGLGVSHVCVGNRKPFRRRHRDRWGAGLGFN